MRLLFGAFTTTRSVVSSAINPDFSSLPGTVPSLAMTTRLVARALGMPPGALAGGLRAAGEGDLPRVLAFRTALVGAGAANDEAYLRWRYRLGRTVPALGELWLLEVDNRLLALIGTEDVVLRADQRRVGAGRPMDLQTLPAARESGLGVWMNQAVAARSAALLAIGGNKFSRGIVRRLFTPLAPLRMFTYVIDSTPFLHKAGLRGPIGGVLAHAGNAAVRVREAWHTWRAGGHCNVQSIERFDGSDPLADAQADAESLSFERSATALNHRLFDNPRARYHAAGAYTEGERRGCVAWRVEPGLEREPQLRVVDLWVADGDDRARVIDALLGHTFAAARRARCHAVRVLTADPRLAARLVHLGFASPGAAGEGMPMGLIVAADAQLARALAARPCAITPLLDDDDGTYRTAYGAS